MKKTITLLLMAICISLSFAFAISDADVITAKVTPYESKEAINIDGLTGEISIISTYDNSKPVVVSVNKDSYLGCQGVQRYMWDNAIDEDNSNYFFDRQSCQLKEEVEEQYTYPCGIYVDWLS